MARTRRIIVTCADEYCPTLPEPRPAMCSIDRSAADPVVLTQDWPELHAAILSRDLGVPRDAGVVVGINRLFVPVTLPVDRSDAASTAPATVIRMHPSASSLEVVLEHDGGTHRWKIPASPSDEDLKQLRQELASQGPTAESRAIIEASGEVAYGAVMKVLDAAKSAGYTKIALSTSPSGADAPAGN